MTEKNLSIPYPHNRKEHAPYEGSSERRVPTGFLLRKDPDRAEKVMRTRPSDI